MVHWLVAGGLLMSDAEHFLIMDRQFATDCQLVIHQWLAIASFPIMVHWWITSGLPMNGLPLAAHH
jgi:hypothetical protein